MLSNGSYDRNYGAPAGGAYPRFFVDQVQDMVASEQQGRPIYREEERVEIIMPGNAQTRFVAKVNREYTERWPKEYAAFKDGIEISPDGTPLEEWPILKRSQVLELKALGFKTVEHVRDMDDHAIQRIGMGGRVLRDNAIAFLDDAARIAMTSQLAAENERKDERIAALERQVSELGALVEQKFGELQTMRNAPSALATHIPGMSDPMEQARQAAPQEVVSSSLDSLGSRRSRRQQQAKSEDAPLV
jgi:hypothetical protein